MDYYVKIMREAIHYMMDDTGTQTPYRTLERIAFMPRHEALKARETMTVKRSFTEPLDHTVEVWVIE